MKLIAILGFVVLSFSAVAGGYYNPSIDTYDSVTGLYYNSVESEKKSGFLGSGGQVITNLYVYNPKTKEGKLIFPEQSGFQVTALAFEEEVVDGEVRFHSVHSAPIKNNNGIASRAPKTKMLILTRNVETESQTFYFSEKDGSNLVKGKTIAPDVDWHIDVKNSEVRLVSQIGQSINIESFPW